MVLPNSLSSYYEKFLATGEVKCIDEEIPFEIPQGWEWCRFGSLMINRDSERIPLSVAQRQTLKKVYDYYGASGVIDKVDKYLFDKDLLLIGEDGANLINRSTPIAFIAKGKYWVNNHAHVLDVCGGLNLAYIALFINAISLVNYVTGTAQPKMNQEKMNSILVTVPPISEQARIVNQIESLQPLIIRYDKAQSELNILNTSVKEQLKKSILQEAIQGHLVPQIVEEGTAEELLAEIRKEKKRLVNEGKLKKSALNDSIIFKGDDNKYFEKVGKTEQDITDEILFEIPDDWKWCRIGSVLNIWSARRVHERDWRSSGIPFYRAREIGKMADWGHVDNDLFIEQSLYDEFSKSGVPQIGDLMMTAVGTLGKTYVVETNNPFYYKDGSVLCIGNPFRLNPYYLKLFFESSAFANQYLSESDGTTVATLTMVRLNRYLIPVPPLKEQTRIVEKIKTVTSIMSR